MATWPARGQKAPNFWDDQLKAYVDEGDAANEVTPEKVEANLPERLSEGGLSATFEDLATSEESHGLVGPEFAVPALSRINHWTATAAVEVTLPSLPNGFQATVHINGFQHVSWGAGITVLGGSKADEVWATVVRDGVGWAVLVPSSEGGGGFPAYDATHPLFAPGSGVAGNLADFNDFFGLNLTAPLNTRWALPFKFPDGTTGYVWHNQATGFYEWTGQSSWEGVFLGNGWLATNSDGVVQYDANAIPMGAGMHPVIGTMLMHFLGASHFRTNVANSASYPTAVNTFANLAPWGSDSSLCPIGVSIFVASLGKPLWKKAANQWVDAAGVAVTSG